MKPRMGRVLEKVTSQVLFPKSPSGNERFQNMLCSKAYGFSIFTSNQSGNAGFSTDAVVYGEHNGILSSPRNIVPSGSIIY